MHKMNIRITKFLVIVGLVFTSITLPQKTVAQESYEFQINAQSVLKVRVGNWNITDKVHEEWAGLSGDYTVGMDGKISFPYIGLVAVQGVRLEEISRNIAARLTVAIGLSREPAVVTEISSYNPIFVTGDVYRPGKYDFKPGMTVRQGIAIAGGIERRASTQSNVEREIVKALGQKRLLIQNQQRLLLRIARLETETKEGAEFVPPQEVEAALLDSGLMEIEQNIFKNNTRALEQKLLSVDDLIELLTTVIQKLGSQIALNNQDISLTQADLDQKKALLKRGTIRAEAVTNLARTLTGLRLRDVELTVEKLRAEQSLNKAKREKNDIKKDNQSNLLEQLDRARTKLAKLTIEIELQSDLYAAALEFGSKTVTNALDQTVSIEVIGHGNVLEDDNSADEKNRLKPGDTIVVRILNAIGD